jgi:cell division protein ZapA
MLNRVVVTIDGLEYTVVSEESEESIRRTANLVDENIASVKKAAPLSSLSATVLAAMNLAESYYKALESTDNLRRQIKDYAEENGRLRAELNRLKRK